MAQSKQSKDMLNNRAFLAILAAAMPVLFATRPSIHSPTLGAVASVGYLRQKPLRTLIIADASLKFPARSKTRIVIGWSPGSMKGMYTGDAPGPATRQSAGFAPETNNRADFSEEATVNPHCNPLHRLTDHVV